MRILGDLNHLGPVSLFSDRSDSGHLGEETEKNVVILHGYLGNADRHWQTWLKAQCDGQGVKAEYPELPSPAYPNLSEWLDALKKIPLNEKTTLVCHSLGCALALQYFYRNKIKIEQLILVAPASLDGIKRSSLTETLGSFYAEIEDFAHLPEELTRHLPSKIHIISSNNDIFLTLDEARSLQRSLGEERTTLLEIKEGGHLGDSYLPELEQSELPPVLDYLGLEHVNLLATKPSTSG